MKLYYSEASPPCTTVTLLTNMLKIPVELIPINTQKGESKTASYLEMNPSHTIPTLVDDDGTVVWESRVIAKYLVEKYAPNDSLYPKDFYQRLEVDKILDFDLGTFFRRSADYLIPALFFGKFDPSKKPKLDDALEVFNRILECNKSGFAAIDRLTIADVSLLATVSRLEVAEYDLKNYFYVTKWLAQIKKSVPNYETIGVKAEAAFKERLTASLNKESRE